MISTDAKIFVAGHRGLVGSAICRRLQAEGYTQLVTRSRAELDLTDQADVRAFYAEEKPDCVILAAAKVGGILANNNYPADFLVENLTIQTNIMDAARRAGVAKLVFLGSSCIYPKFAEQPIREESLLTGALEPTNEWYAVAKIAGIKTCQAFRRQYGLDAISLMPTNLYGPGDNFDLASSHVLPALIRKFHEAGRAGSGKVVVWGTGTPRREFLHVDDLAAAVVFLMNHYSEESIINVGSGEDLTIAELCEIVREVTGFAGEIEYDTGKPDGTPRKVMDVSRIRALGWAPKVSLQEGIAETYRWFLENEAGLG